LGLACFLNIYLYIDIDLSCIQDGYPKIVSLEFIHYSSRFDHLERRRRRLRQWLEGKLKVTEIDGDMFYGIAVKPEASGKSARNLNRVLSLARLFEPSACLVHLKFRESVQCWTIR